MKYLTKILLIVWIVEWLIFATVLFYSLYKQNHTAPLTFIICMIFFITAMLIKSMAKKDREDEVRE